MSLNQKTKADKDVVTNKKTFLEVYKKWDRTIAPAFGLLAFFTLIGIVIYNIIYAESTSCETKENDTRMATENFVSQCFESQCEVHCYNLTIDYDGKGLLVRHINDAMRENVEKCTNIKLLKLHQCDFQDKTLKNGWLENVSRDIEKLSIFEGNLKEIDENALSGSVDTFYYLELLYLIELNNMRTLKRKYFLGMKSLKYFEFQSYTLRPLRVEENALEGMQNVLSVSYSQVILDDEALSNSFGCTGARLNKLEIVSLQHGSVDKLTDCSFTNIPNIKSIYLRNVNLESIDKNTFERNLRIQILDLRQNNLKTLQNGTFNKINRDEGAVDVYLGNNMWHCNCSLQWLKDDLLREYYINNTSIPLCNDSIQFTHVEFCSTTSSTEHITSSSSPRPPSTTVPTPRQLKINCSVHDESPISINEEVTDTYSVSIEIDNNCVHLEFREYSTDPLKIQLSSNVSLKNYYLVWFDSDNKGDHGCETLIHNSTILKNLKQDTTYTFNVIRTCDDNLSPSCTFGLKTTAEWNKRIWISNKYRTIVIATASTSIVVIIALTILGTFFFIRNFPAVISGNKSVIVVKPKKTSEDFEPPKDFEKPDVYFTDPYLKSISHGYLTPKFHKYDKVRYRPPIRRSISEWSLANTSTAYDDPKQIYEMRSLHSRLQERNAILRNRYNDFRPPLPPPNGRNQAHLETHFDEESLYNSV